MNKLVNESISNILKPKSPLDVINAIKNLSVDKKIEEIKKMERHWGDMYKNLLNNPDVLKDIRDEVKTELNNLSILNKVNYIEKLEKILPDIFSGMKNKKILKDLKEFIINQKFEDKSKLVWRFFKSWPDLFKDVQDDPRIDPETNQLMLLFKIKGAMDNNEIEKLQKLIHELGERYGRENILDKATEIKIPENNKNLFNQKDIQQLKLSLFKETRSEKEQKRDEYYDIYAFIGYSEFIEKEINGEILHKKRLGIENLVKLDKYNSSSLAQVPMMKIRAQHQYGGKKDSGVFCVYIPKEIWNKDYAGNEEIPNYIRKYIEENKFTI